MNRSIFTVVLLIGVYIALQLVADVSAAKIVAIGDITLPAGSMVFALTFTWRDLLHKRLGKQWAQAAIWTAAFANLGMVAYFLLAIQLPPAAFWTNQDAFASVLGIVPRIAVASIVAELVSELIDTEVYHRMVRRFSERHQWARVLVSNAVSVPVDSAIFGTLAFAGTLPLEAVVSIAIGQIVFKYLVAGISIPLIYTVRESKQVAQVSFAPVGD